jgi:acetyl esterase/lipase
MPSPEARRLEEVLRRYRWLLDQGYDPARAVIAGDSSGGGLTVAALLSIRDAGLHLPAGAVPISPWTDLAFTGGTYASRAAVDLTVALDGLKRMAGQYLAGADARTPRASPVYADLAGLPPLLIVVGGDEILLDDAVRLARAAGMAGVDTTFSIAAGMQHVFPLYAGLLPETDAAIATIGAWVRARLH